MVRQGEWTLNPTIKSSHTYTPLSFAQSLENQYAPTFPTHPILLSPSFPLSPFSSLHDCETQSPGEMAGVTLFTSAFGSYTYSPSISPLSISPSLSLSLPA